MAAAIFAHLHIGGLGSCLVPITCYSPLTQLSCLAMANKAAPPAAKAAATAADAKVANALFTTTTAEGTPTLDRQPSF